MDFVPNLLGWLLNSIVFVRLVVLSLLLDLLNLWLLFIFNWLDFAVMGVVFLFIGLLMLIIILSNIWVLNVFNFLGWREFFWLNNALLLNFSLLNSLNF